MDYKEFLQALKEKTNYDFCDYSENSISRRLQVLCKETGLSFEEILDKVQADVAFQAKVVEDITVNTTELFRDPLVWVSLFKTLYKQLPKARITIWHVGCSVGLEVYSNLILLNELGLLDKCRVIGSDINQRVLDIAKNGVYAYKFNAHFRVNFDVVMQGIGSQSRFEDYFEIDEAKDTMRVKENMRCVPLFMRQNLVEAKCPFAYKVDVVFFRNVMIYFNSKLQVKILNMVYNKMYNGAAIVMGKQEQMPMSMLCRFNSSGLFYRKANID